jgi:hypothetical protein
MKTARMFLIWIIGVVLSCSLAWNSFFQGGGGSRAVPHANIQLLIKLNRTAAETIDQVEKVILSLNYVRLSRNELISDQERGYRKQNFKILYSPEQGAYGSQALWIHFYQEDKYTFDDTGFAEYESLRTALLSTGLDQSLENDPRYPGRTVLTPEMFNEAHPNPERRTPKEQVFLLSTLASYFFLFFWPGLWIVSKLFNHLTMTITTKRVLFVVVISLLLAPAPLPLIMFGPVLLLPMPFALPFVLQSLPFLKLLAVSIGGTAIFASLISLILGYPPHQVRS